MTNLRCVKPLPIDERRIGNLLEQLDEAERQMRDVTGITAALTEAVNLAHKNARHA